MVLEGGREGKGTYFYLEEIFRRAIDLLEALLARIWDGLHGCND
jgi:hypothetical protein